MNFKWQCPKCGAEHAKHGRGECGDGRKSCDGLVCECDLDPDDQSSELPSHGVSLSNKCKNACCYHCGWGGTLPRPPKGLAAWERTALDAGWTPPKKRAAELTAMKSDTKPKSHASTSK